MRRALVPVVVKRPIIPPCGEEADAECRRIFSEAERTFGHVPNIVRTAARSVAAARGLWALQSESEAMLTPRLREAIALRIAELNACEYCLEEHGVSARNRGMTTAEVVRARQGSSSDRKEQALLALVTKLVRQQGHHARLVVDAAREVGVSDAELVESVALVALNVFRNYLCELASTEAVIPTRSNERADELEQSRR